jgi:hypothetical protein
VIFRTHIPRVPLSQFIEAFIYFERAEHAYTGRSSLIRVLSKR